MHLRHVAALEVMHQFADIRRASRRSVHVDDMRSVTENLSRLLLDSLIDINILTVSHHIVLGNEDDVCVTQLAEVLAGLERVRIHQRGVVPRPLRLRAVVGTLDFDIVFPVLTAFRLPLCINFA